MANRICPGCGRHCYLDEARCERGVEYAQTGILPPRKPRSDGGHGGRKPSELMLKYRTLPQESKLAASIQAMTDVIREQESKVENQADLHSEMFSCLREEDRADLLLLLEKVRHSWRHRYEQSVEAVCSGAPKD